jgi:hypothetical protein
MRLHERGAVLVEIDGALGHRKIRIGRRREFSEDPDSLFGLIADADPLAQVRVPLPAGSGAAGATQAADSYEYSTATAASSTGAAATHGAAADSASATSGTATDCTTATNGTADTGMSAPTAEAGMGAPAAPAAMTAAAAAATAATCNSNALAKRGIFPVEDLKGRQADVRDFLLAQNISPCVVL